MQPRISQSSLYQQYPDLVKHLTAVGDIVNDARLTPQLLHLVKLRASQLNHCGFCQHMHANEARADGESQARLDVLPAWRELSLFSDSERAALAWTEALTQVSKQPISAELFQNAIDCFGERGVIELTAVIVQINSWNRIAVSFCFQPDISK